MTRFPTYPHSVSRKPTPKGDQNKRRDRVALNAWTTNGGCGLYRVSRDFKRVLRVLVAYMSTESQ